MCFGCSKEPSHWDGSFEYPQHVFWMRNKENSFPIRTLIRRPELFMLCCCLLTFFKIDYFKKFFQAHYQSVNLNPDWPWSGSKLFAKISRRRQKVLARKELKVNVWYGLAGDLTIEADWWYTTRLLRAVHICYLLILFSIGARSRHDQDIKYF